MDSWEGAQLNKAKEILAWELTNMVHGEEEANKAQAAAKALFGAGAVSADMPSTEIAEADFGEGMTIVDIMVKCKLTSSKGEARRLVDQGGVTVNDVKVESPMQIFTAEDVKKGDFVIKKGKKTFHKVICK
jgi:tyrosyl-tRNA synthetase